MPLCGLQANIMSVCSSTRYSFDARVVSPESAQKGIARLSARATALSMFVAAVHVGMGYVCQIVVVLAEAGQHDLPICHFIQSRSPS
jgi:hypothetical protein